MKEEDILKNMAFKNIRTKIEDLQLSILKDFDKKINAVTSEIVKEVHGICIHQNGLPGLSSNDVDNDRKKKSRPSGQLPEKQFIPRNSMLLDLYKVSHIRTVYHLALVIFIILFLNTLVHDLVAYGRINLGIPLILAGFRKFHVVIIIWLGMQICTIALHKFFTLWAKPRLQMPPKSFYKTCWDIVFLASVLVYQCLFVYLPVRGVLDADLPPASSVIVLMEQIRFLMKTYAFLRVNIAKVCVYKPKSDDTQIEEIIPTLSTYIYFLFAPTLIYRDSYPRTDRIRWIMVTWHSMEIIGIIFFISFLLERFAIPYFHDFGTRPLSASSLVLAMFGCIMPGILIFMSVFYCILHACMNIGGELTTFADRLFYQDWWNTASYSEYYRKWNIVIHDWLYTYVYKDIYENLTPKSKLLPTFMVFLISAVVHEYLIAFSLKFFYPVLFVLFGFFGTLLIFIKNEKYRHTGNVLLWLSWTIGNGILLSMYSMEFFSRINCPLPSNETNWYNFYVKPRTWSCSRLVLNPDWEFTFPWE